MKGLLPALALPAVALAVAGCGNNGYSGNAAASTRSNSTPATGTATVALGSTGLGKVLTGAGGRTLYLFERDHGPKSTCFGACASAWPPLVTSGKPKAGAGVSAAKLSSTNRGGGVREVTYNGHPLYLYAGDTARGQTNGEGLDQFGAEWYAVSAGGGKIEQHRVGRG